MYASISFQHEEAHTRINISKVVWNQCCHVRLSKSNAEDALAIVVNPCIYSLTSMQNSSTISFLEKLREIFFQDLKLKM